MTQNTVKPHYQGKVRDIYDLGDSLIIKTSDRISAFDHVFSEEIFEKGKILNRISNHWFSLIGQIKNHIIETELTKFPPPFNTMNELAGRSVWVHKAERVNFECVARGYLMGSGFKEYQKTGRVCGIPLPNGLSLAEKLEEPIFTPATKNDQGHDENVSFSFMADQIGTHDANLLKSLTLELYLWANTHLEPCGILLLDTKFEFGLFEGEIILIDEVLTPDSSRFCRVADYEASLKKNASPPSMDKQSIRDHLEKIHWDKKPPLPALPASILEETRKNYLEIERKILSISIRS